MSETDLVIAELERTLARMKEYRDRGVEELTYLRYSIDVKHAAAYRASLDCWRALAKWRKAGKKL